MKLEGSLVALITPMSESGSVDYIQLQQLIEYHIQAGTHGIVSVGTTGESSTLSVEEHLMVIEKTIEIANKRLSVIAGTGANSTKEAIYQTQQAKSLGADAALLVVPYYNKPTQEGLYQHYKAIAESVDIPQIVYNVPGRTSLDMTNDTIVRLSHFDNIVACKEASGDLQRAPDLIERCADRLVILSGDDVTALELMKLGAKGDISVTANVAPHAMSEMCNAALSGDFAKAEKINQILQDLHQLLFLESNPIPVKYAVSKMGYTSNTLRLPLTSLDESHTGVIDAAMENYSKQYLNQLTH